MYVSQPSRVDLVGLDRALDEVRYHNAVLARDATPWCLEKCVLSLEQFHDLVCDTVWFM